MLKESLFIDQVIVIGENQKFAGALIVPDFTFLKSYCQVKEIEFISNEEVVKIPRIRKRIQTEIDKYNKLLGDTEKVRTWELIDHEWTLETGEITPTLKLKRNVILKRYEDTIRALFL